jgi:hypothetical protein
MTVEVLEGTGQGVQTGLNPVAPRMGVRFVYLPPFLLPVNHGIPWSIFCRLQSNPQQVTTLFSR